MPLDVSLAAPFEHLHEKQMWDQLSASLTEKCSREQLRSVLLGNFMCDGRGLDALLIRRQSITVIEMKAMQGTVEFFENDPWRIDGRSVGCNGFSNPFLQTRTYKFAVVDRLRQAWKKAQPIGAGAEPNWLHISGAVVFKGPIIVNGGLPYTITKWFQIYDLEDASEVTKLHSPAITLGESAIDWAKQAVLGRRLAPAGRTSLLYVHQSTFNQAVRDLISKGGTSLLAANVFRSFQSKLQAGKNPFKELPCCQRDEIQRLEIYEIGSGHRLAVIHHENTYYLGTIGSTEAVESWIDSNRGLQYTIDLETGVIRPTWVGTDRPAAPVQATIANNPFLSRLQGLDLAALGAPKLAVKALLLLNESSSEEDEMEALEAVPDASVRQLLLELLALLKSGDVTAAQARLDVFNGSAAPVEDVPETHRDAVKSEINSSSVVDLADLPAEDWERLFDPMRFQEWMLFLHPSQKRVVDENFSRPAILTGVSGSGKTCVLVHRARRLAREYPDERILILTLNRSLARLIENLVGRLCTEGENKRISVWPFHAYLEALLSGLQLKEFLEKLGGFTNHEDAVKALLKATPESELGELFKARDERELFEQFLEFNSSLPPRIKPESDNLEIFVYAQDSSLDFGRYLYEELELVRSAFPCYDNYQAYLTGYEREGRSIQFQKERREQILKILHEWEGYQIENRFFDHMGLSQAALFAIEEQGSITDSHRYRCVLVDEFQDFSTLDIKLLQHITGEGNNNLFLTGDFAQKVYAKELDLGKVGLGPHQRDLRSIRKNYRNSRQILEAASRLLEVYPPPVGKDSELRVLKPELADRDSAKPIALKCVDPLAQAWHEARIWLGSGHAAFSVCIATANTAVYPVEAIHAACPKDLGSVELSGDYLRDPTKVIVSDMASIKGFEFTLVVIVGLEVNIFPPKGRPTDERWRDAMRLYVAITRGRDEVRFPYQGQPSEFLGAMGETVDLREAMPLPVQEEEVGSVAVVVDEVIPVEKRIQLLNGYPVCVLPHGLNEFQITKILQKDQTEISIFIQQDVKHFVSPDRPLRDHIIRKVFERYGILVSFSGGVEPGAEMDFTGMQPASLVGKNPDLPVFSSPTLRAASVLPAEPLDVAETQELRLADVWIHSPKNIEVDVQSVSGECQRGSAVEWKVDGPSVLSFTIQDVSFENEERLVMCAAQHNEPEVWSRIVGRLRQTIRKLDDGDFVMDLRQARLKHGGWSGRYYVDRAELNQWAGADVFQTLLDLGATAVGTKAQVYGDTKKFSEKLCVRFPAGNSIVPSAAYVLTTIIPLHRGASANLTPETAQ